MSTFIGVHVLHPIPPSSINRGEDGLPKTATYGPVLRGRLSSQSQKAAVREAMRLAGYETATRTTRIPQLVWDRLPDRDSLDEDVASEVDKFLAKTLNFRKPKETKKGETAEIPTTTGSLLSLTDRQMEVIFELTGKIVKGEKQPSKANEYVEKRLNELPTADQALFGRMFSSNPAFSIEAASQVAHAITIDGIEMELDFFTALGDTVAERDNAGADHMGIRAFWSGVAYRTASVHVDQLIETIGAQSAADTAVDFLRTFAVTLPSGGKNSFNHNTLPTTVIYTKGDRPVNLASAYFTPDPTDGSERLEQEIERAKHSFQAINDSHTDLDVVRDWLTK